MLIRTMIIITPLLRPLMIDEDNCCLYTVTHLIYFITQVGQQEKLARDLETKIEAEQSRMSTNNIQQIQQDLQQIQAENDQLIATIKQLVAS